jgi:hypothetical protein
MPNHFHLYVKQKTYASMNHFMRSLATRYAMYFNKKYKRVGPLFQGIYKAVYVDNELQYLYLSKYIHRNPLELVENIPTKLVEYPYSSYRNYLGIIHQDWVHPEEMTSYYSKEYHHIPYQEFVEEYSEHSTEISTLGNITLDWET